MGFLNIFKTLTTNIKKVVSNFTCNSVRMDLERIPKDTKQALDNLTPEATASLIASRDSLLTEIERVADTSVKNTLNKLD